MFLLYFRAYSLQSTGSSDSDEILRSPLQATYYMADHRKLAALQDQQFVTLGKPDNSLTLASPQI